MTEPKRVTSLDRNYRHGDLSVFPQAIDSHFTLYLAANNAETTLKHGVTTTSKYLVVDNSDEFPGSGLLKITDPVSGEYEIIFYGKKIGNQFHLLQRGYDNKRHGPWQSGAKVSCPVMAEHHNALKDAILKIQKKLGLVDNPDPKSINGLLKTLEQRWLAPKVAFKSLPRVGPPPLTVRFQNFSGGHNMKYLWDFGDGTTSTEKHPTHVYVNEGFYSVKLNIVSSTGAQGVTEKQNYIEVNKQQRVPFFYGSPLHGYSVETSLEHEMNGQATKPTEFEFIDQTEGLVLERHWFFGDGTDVTVANPMVHTIKHVYEKPGDYMPVLMVKFSDDIISRANILEGIMVA